MPRTRARIESSPHGSCHFAGSRVPSAARSAVACRSISPPLVIRPATVAVPEADCRCRSACVVPSAVEWAIHPCISAGHRASVRRSVSVASVGRRLVSRLAHSSLSHNPSMSARSLGRLPSASAATEASIRRCPVVPSMRRRWGSVRSSPSPRMSVVICRQASSIVFSRGNRKSSLPGVSVASIRPS